MKRIVSILTLLSIFLILLLGCAESAPARSFSLDAIPEFDGSTPYVVINEGIPDFSEDDLVTTSYERYSPLDKYGRCTLTAACIGVDIMPTEKREDIGAIKPTGWANAQYDIVEGGFVYNRCHLIGFQLTGENANKENLITGTRFMNVNGMLPFENMVADYVKETENHVLYRVTPIFEGQNLVASGVLMEAKSVEDNGEGIEFCVYVYNAQPGITIDYLTGRTHLSNEKAPDPEEDPYVDYYVLNTSSKKIHTPRCSSVIAILEKNKEIYEGSISELLEKNYTPCGICDPQ